MLDNTKSRKWQVTINNPIQKGLSHESIIECLKDLKAVYYCLCDEIGDNGTFHTHIFIYRSNAIRFSRLLKVFEGGHFEMAKGTCEENRFYILKEGKWATTSKKETSVEGTFFEFGEMPIERQGHRNDLDDLYDMIKSGMSNFDILETSPQYLLNIDKIERCRQTVKEEQYKNVWRKLSITYVYGDTGAGKTRTVMEQYGYINVFRVTDYEHPFDAYKGQSVVIFEEFRSSLKIQNMLSYLDGYPVELPCRYANKFACFDTVYIISNVELSGQYPNVQRECEETWKSFLRRIHNVRIYSAGQVFETSTDIYMDGFVPSASWTPFDTVNSCLKQEKLNLS